MKVAKKLDEGMRAPTSDAGLRRLVSPREALTPAGGSTSRKLSPAKTLMPRSSVVVTLAKGISPLNESLRD